MGAHGAAAAPGPEPRRVLFLFLDGVGLGVPDPAVNPLAAARLPVLEGLLDGPLLAGLPPVTRGGLVYRPLDATLGVEGLPQSATGQTTLLTGLNAAQAMQRHYGPWPGPTLIRVLEAGSLFHTAQRLAGAVLANAYPDGYFAAMQGRRFRPNAPAVAARSAGLELRDLEAYRRGEAVAADLSGARFARLRPGLAEQPPEEAARVLARLAAGNSLTFFDLWPTDALGHARDHVGAVALLERLDVLVGALVELAEEVGFTLVMTSDHGNVEDLSVKGHTENPVPLLVAGEGAAEFVAATSLLDVAPAIERFWDPGIIRRR